MRKKTKREKRKVKNGNLNEGFKGTKADPVKEDEKKKSIWKIKNCRNEENGTQIKKLSSLCCLNSFNWHYLWIHFLYTHCGHQRSWSFTAPKKISAWSIKWESEKKYFEPFFFALLSTKRWTNKQFRIIWLEKEFRWPFFWRAVVTMEEKNLNMCRLYLRWVSLLPLITITRQKKIPRR